MEGTVINWFEITTPPGYYSINDTLGDILSTFRGKIAILKLLKQLMNGQKSGDRKQESGTVAGFKLNKGMLEMAKSFTIKRILMMVGNSLTKEQILKINASLNRIKK